MIEVTDLTEKECLDILASVGYAHLGCTREDEPYVVPIHYAFSEGLIYLYTTEGKKYEIIKENPRVCIQVESVEDNRNWVSVIVQGEAMQVSNEEERDLALKLILDVNPTLTPAVSIRWMDSWVRENIEVIYRVTPLEMTGRASVPGSEARRAFVPKNNQDATLQ
jgi:nitroimidazol reductase NimA-like FMN-containing flavoprotein (pyridoxamine 5'-phosphate oxidase superfamily)